MRTRLRMWPLYGPQPVARAFSGIHYGASKIVYFGGGHLAYPGNDVAMFDCLEDHWTTSVYPPEWPGMFPGDISSDKSIREGGPAVYGGSGSPVLSDTNKPFVCHTYQQIVYCQPLRGFLAALRPAGTFILRPWSRDGRYWTRISPWELGGGVETHGLLEWDPCLKVTYALVTGGPGAGVYWLALSGNAGPLWIRKGDLPSKAWTSVYSTRFQQDACNPARHLVRAWDKWFHFASGRMYETYDTDERRTDIDSFVAAPNGRVLGLSHKGPGKVRGWIRHDEEWHAVEVTGDVPTGRDGRKAAAPMLAWDPLNERAIFLNAYVNEFGYQGGRTQTYHIQVEDY